VGAGGIGCELLKDLALSGFRTVEVIDLDTIDVSNLNRQLLFRSQHVGMAKCTVACQVATDMVPPLPNKDSDDNGTLPQVRYHAHHGNVCDATKFNVPFIQQFDLVLNALDNVEARRRVNRLCLAANVALVEAGTTGYLGQVTVIHKSSNVACYECKTQETQKVYPICTIRSTPSAPVHCIVWAKELYKLLFHSKVEESMLYEPDEGSNDNDGAGGKEETGEDGSESGTSGGPSTYMPLVKTLRGTVTSATNDSSKMNKDVKAVLKALFCAEIQKQLDMGRYKTAKKTPTCLDASVIDKGVELGSPTSSSTTSIWSLEDNVAALVQCLNEASARSADEKAPQLLEEFDKDDDLAMKFVTAASNLRSSVFGIEPLQSLYSAKGIAGNIIPAIATTNAICAGLQILQAFKILKKQIELASSNPETSANTSTELSLADSCLYINCIRNRTRNGLYLTASPLEMPNPKCYVCQYASIPLAINVNDNKWTLKEFIARVIKKRLGFEEPTLMLDGDFIWEEGDGADEEEFKCNLEKPLAKLPCGGIKHGTVLEIDDNSQNLSIKVMVSHREVWDSLGEDEAIDDFPFHIGAAPPSARAKEEASNAFAATSNESETSKATSGEPIEARKQHIEEDDDDEILIIDEDDDGKGSSGKKRAGDDPDENDENPQKKQKMTPRTNDVDVIEID
jgi:ubiquitin-like 1-activating enzyme E1 B